MECIKLVRDLNYEYMSEPRRRRFNDVHDVHGVRDGSRGDVHDDVHRGGHARKPYKKRLLVKLQATAIFCEENARSWTFFKF